MVSSEEGSISSCDYYVTVILHCFLVIFNFLLTAEQDMVTYNYGVGKVVQKSWEKKADRTCAGQKLLLYILRFLVIWALHFFDSCYKSHKVRLY